MRGRKRRRTGNETGETRTSPRFPPGHGARHLKPAKPPPADVTVNADQAMVAETVTTTLVGYDRSQSTLFPERLDDCLGEDNPVRAPGPSRYR
jgi:thiamine biosynthesis lipoprotein ApbE